MAMLPIAAAGWRYRRMFFTIDDEGLYDEPIVHTVGEIARAPARAPSLSNIVWTIG